MPQVDRSPVKGGLLKCWRLKRRSREYPQSRVSWAALQAIFLKLAEMPTLEKAQFSLSEWIENVSMDQSLV